MVGGEGVQGAGEGAARRCWVLHWVLESLVSDTSSRCRCSSPPIRHELAQLSDREVRLLKTEI